MHFCFKYIIKLGPLNTRELNHLLHCQFYCHSISPELIKIYNRKDAEIGTLKFLKDNVDSHCNISFRLYSTQETTNKNTHKKYLIEIYLYFIT